MSMALIHKLGRYTRLSEQDKASLLRLTQQHVRRLPAHEDIISEGDNPLEINLMLTGWGCRYKNLKDGRRQIIAFLLPGDLCDHSIFILREMDHSICALTPVTVAGVTRALFEEITLSHPRITQAMWWESLVTSAIQREWTVNLGQRSALERIAHLLCELYLRLQAVGMANGASCEFPITQADLGDATGLSAVHVNRTLQELRNGGLIELKTKTLHIPDLRALMRVALFNTNYLHHGHDGSMLDSNEI